MWGAEEEEGEGAGVDGLEMSELGGSSTCRVRKGLMESDGE